MAEKKEKNVLKESEMSDFARKLLDNESAPLFLKEKTRSLSTLQKLSFGLGHVINDILGVLWFSYALVFLQFVVGIQPTVSAFLIFLGQFTDAVATPFIGMMIDKFGRKKRWNAAGVVLIASSFLFIFHDWNDISFYTICCYAIAITIFQLGWATVQISHLSLIPDMTIFLQERAELTSLRYIIFVCSNILIYLVAYFILQESKTGDLIESRDGWKFEVVAIVAVCMGITGSIIFQCMLQIPEVPRNNKSTFSVALQTWKTLISTNMQNSGILAGAPLLNFSASLFSSLLVNFITKKSTNNKMIFTAGTTFAFLSCICIYIDPNNLNEAVYIYGASVLCGIGSAMTVITSLCIAANFIGNDIECGAFIYGIITFSDKILTGLFIFLIESIKGSNLINSEHYYKFVLSFVNGTLTILGYIFLLLLPTSVCNSS